MSASTTSSSEPDSYVGTLKITPSNYQKWVNDYLIHAKAKFGIYADVFVTLKAPKYDYAKQFKIEPTDPLLSEYNKKSMDAMIGYDQNKPKMFGDLMMHISPDSTTRVKAHADYKNANTNNDVVTLWKIITATHITKPSTKATQVQCELNAFRDLKQGTMGIEKYNEKFKFQVEKLVELGGDPPETEIVTTYLYSLSAIFVDVAKKMLKDSAEYPLPASLVQATNDIAEWYHSETAVNKMFGIAAPAPPQKSDTALLAGAKVEDQPGPGKNAKRNKNHKKKREAKGEGGEKAEEKSAQTAGKGKSHCEFCKRGGYKHDNHNMADCKHFASYMKNSQDKQGGKEKGQTVNSKLAMEAPAAVDAQDTFDWPEEVNVSGYMALSSAGGAATDALTVVFDTGTTSLIVREKCLLHDMKKLSRPVRIKGVAGDLYAYEMGIMGPFGPALYVPESPVTLVNWIKMKERGFSRKFDDAEDAFIFERAGIRYIFRLCTDKSSKYHNLYIMTMPRKGKAVAEKHVMSAAAQVVNHQIFTTREIERAHQARRLHQHLDHISDHNLCALLNAGGIMNCSTTAVDVRNAAKILGPCVDCIQGKMTEPTGKPSVRPTCENPAELLFMDLFFVHDGVSTKKAPHLLSVDGRYGHIIVTKLASKHTAALTVAIQDVINIYRSLGHTVKEIRVDHEQTFLACKGVVNGMGVQLSATAPGQHNSRAERPIRTIRTRFRAVLASLGYKLPRILYPFLVMSIVQSLNMTPNVHTFPLTPRELMTGHKIDAATTLRAKFGDFVIAKTPNMGKDQDDLPTGELGIVVGRDPAGKGNIKIYKLDTNTVVTRAKFSPIAPSPEHLNKINTVAGKDMPVDNTDIEDESGDNTDAPSVRDLLEGPTHTTGVVPPVREDLHVPAPEQETPEQRAAAPPAPLQSPHVPQGVVQHALPVAPGAAQGVGVSGAHNAPLPHVAVEQPPVAVAPAPLPAVAIPAEPPPPPAPSQRYIHPLSPDRRSTRRRTTWQEASERKENYGLQVSVSRALKLYPDAAVQALGQEALQLIDMRALFPVHQEDLSPNPARSIIPSIMFLKEKHKPDGAFDKLKARMAGGGHVMNPAAMAHVEVSSPTVDPTSVFTMAAIAAHQGLGCSVTDIKGAYLNADLPDSMDVVMIVDRVTTAVLVALRPEYRKYVRSNGTMLTRVKKALYGLPQAGLLWYQHLKKTLEKAGYRATSADTCVFTKNTNRSKSIICVHVDDLFHAFSDARLDDELQRVLVDVYKEVNHTRGDKLDYLGMCIEFDRKAKSVSLKNPGYINDILSHYNISGTAATPSTNNLLVNRENVERVDQNMYASMVMKLMYVAKKTRIDILHAVTHLATRITVCNADDYSKLIRVYKYLNGTRDKGITLSPDSLAVVCYADASYATHCDAKSHSGAVLALGTRKIAAVYVRSVKQKLVSRSSTEAELIALHDILPQVLWLRRLLADLGYPPSAPTVVYQDNKSTIILGNKGNANKGKTKHMEVRYFFLKEKIDDKSIVLEYLPTEAMLADFYTKPLAFEIFVRLRDVIMGNEMK